MSDRRDRPLRVLHCPTDVGGNPSGLARAERALGLDSVVAVVERSPYLYDVDIDLNLGGPRRLRRLAGRARFALKALREFDVIHFNFGQTLLPRLGSLGIDLPMLRACGKRLFMTFQGCDARQTGYCREHYEVSCCGRDAGPGLCRIEDDAAKQRTIAYARRHCHRLFCVNPDLLHVVPGAEFVPYASVDPARIAPAGPTGNARPVILHAPTHRVIKGTAHVIDAIERLRARHDFEFQLIEGLTHEEAMRVYRRADIVIDQLRMWGYGAFSVELMAMGKPVVCHVCDEDIALMPPNMVDELPIIRASAEDLHDVLDGLLSDPGPLREIGSRSRAFVERWHDPARIARRMIEIYRDPDLPFWDQTGSLPAAAVPPSGGMSRASVASG